MQLRKSILILLASILTFSGCSNPPKKMLLANSDFVLYGEVNENNYLLTPTLEEFDNLYNSNLNYIIAFVEDGCSACEHFKPILQEYAKNYHQLIVSVGGSDMYRIQEKYNDKFFPNTNAKFPSIFVKENNDNIYHVDYTSFMGTYGAFKNHLASRYQTSKCAYFYGEINVKSPVISQYSLINFNSNDVFKNKISSKVLDTQKNVILNTNFEDNSLSLFEKNSDGEFVLNKSSKLDENINDETIAQYI